MSTLKVKLEGKIKPLSEIKFKLELHLQSKLQIFCTVAALAFCTSAALSAAQSPNLGRPLTPEEIKKVDITVVPDGRGLPAGSGSVSSGAAVYAKNCQSCHGEKGAGKPQDQLACG